MLRERREAAEKVAKSLFALEKAIDRALAQSAELNAVMPTASAEANLNALVIQDAYEGAASVFAALAQARRHVVDTHRRLDETKTLIGLRTVNFGDGTPKPPLTERGLSLVETQHSKAA